MISLWFLYCWVRTPSKQVEKVTKKSCDPMSSTDRVDRMKLHFYNLSWYMIKKEFNIYFFLHDNRTISLMRLCNNVMFSDTCFLFCFFVALGVDAMPLNWLINWYFFYVQDSKSFGKVVLVKFGIDRCWLLVIFGDDFDSLDELVERHVWLLFVVRRF